MSESLLPGETEDAAPAPYRAIIWDLDGVLRIWDPAETPAIEARYALPEGTIFAAAFDDSLADRAVTGRISDETWRLATRNAVVRACGEAAAAAVEEWTRLTGAIDRAMVELVAALRPRWRTALLSNATTRLEDDLRRAKLDTAFDVIVSSARIGFAKPDARIFRAAAHRLGVPPGQCILIDDRPANVEGAAALGMHAILFEGIEALRVRLDAVATGIQ